MTEFWKSQAMYWCDICKVWLKDDAQAKAVHERGAKHQENVAKRLRDMRRRAEEEKKSEAQLATTMKNIEQAAAAQFSRDKDEELRYRKATLGEWVLNTESGYHYNALHRWYYDTKSKMYYGGDPPDWTQQPADLPPSARFEAMHAPLTAPRQAPVVSQPRAPAGAAAKAHPLAAVGGYAMPSAGRIGGAKSIGFVDDASKKADGDQKASDPKKKRKIDKSLPPEEREALLRREAARARVEKRTMATFGLQ